MLFKIFKYSIKNFDLYKRFLDTNQEISIYINKNLTRYITNSISFVDNNYLFFEYTFPNNIEQKRFKSYLSLKTDLLFYEINSEMYSFFSNFLLFFQKYLKKQNINFEYENIVINREKIWNFISSFHEVLNIEILTEKGPVELREDWNEQLREEGLKFEINEYPINWAQLAFKDKNIFFQLHYYIHEINIPDYVDSRSIFSLFKFFEERIML